MILNVNRVTAPLIKSGNLVEVLKEFLGERSADIDRINPLNKKMPAQVRWKILRFLKGMRISIDTCGPKDRL